MTTTKPQKDKPFAPAPKLVPRPTVASVARAALVSNRNLNINNTPVAQRMAPSRAPSSPNLRRKNSVCQRTLPSAAETKMDTKTDPHMDIKEDSLQKVKRQQGAPTAISEDTEECKQDLSPETDTDDNGTEPPFGISTPLVDPSSQASDVSRPDTPKKQTDTQIPKGSRPSTPRTPRTLDSVPHPTPTSRPTTPMIEKSQLQPNSNPRTSQQPPVPMPHEQAITIESVDMTSDISQLMDEGDIKSAYSAKEKQFHEMKKELDLKQQAVLEVFDSLRSLRERMSRETVSGGGEGTLQELLMFNVADWPADELSQLYRDAVADIDGAGQLIDSIPVDEYSLSEVEAKVHSIPNQFAELCLQAFSARQELIDWIKELLQLNNLQENGEGEVVQKIDSYNKQGLQLCESLRQLKNHADTTVNTVSCLSKRVLRDQNVLIGVGKALVRDIARLKQDLETHASLINEIQQHRSETDTNVVEETRKELEEEKSAKLYLKEKLAVTESQLRQSRNRIAKMDRQLHEAETSITTLTGTVKTLEDQSRQREAHIEVRARKLRESLKTGEVASGHLVQQRDALQAEVTQLKDQIEQLTAEHEATVKDLKNQLIKMNAALEQQIQSNHEMQLQLTTERDEALAETKATWEQLQAKILELEQKEQNTGRNLPTAREIELLAELQATKVALHVVEDEVVVCKREKIRFLETLTKISDSENKVGMQQKLAAELVSKEEILGKMQIQMRELVKNDRLLEQKISQYEQYISDLQAHNAERYNGEDSKKETNYQELQKEILSLRMKLLEAVHTNEELSEEIAQKDQQLEQHSKTSRAQARVIKVREELINMLKNKETEQSRELLALQQDLENRMKIVDEVNKQIATKAVEIQELFATLEGKQQQIHRLEKIVLALEEQQRRAQAQRTRHEEKIAALEHELASGACRRERKFLFF